MPQYVATNTTARSGISEPSNRSVLRIDGSRLHPERTYRFDEFTSDILKAMEAGNLQVETDQGVPVTIETLENQGLKLRTKTVTERTRNVDGRVDRSYEKYYLEEAGETDEETAQQEPAEDESTGEEPDDPGEDTTETDDSTADAENDESGNDEADMSMADDAENEEAGPEDDEASSKTDGEPSVLETLKEKGAIPEDAESSSDVNAAPMSKIIRQVGGQIPDSFFEDETRKTVLSALEE